MMLMVLEAKEAIVRSQAVPDLSEVIAIYDRVIEGA